MSSARPGSPGATRQCPHCRETILESAAVCPACRHHLRFGAGAVAPLAPALTPLCIEGKIEGGGSVRVAGKFKGDVNVQGDLTIESGAKLTGSVRADKVTIAGELEGNVEQSSHVDVLQTGVVIGDLKAGSVTVATGARMRGQAEFGWDEGDASKAGKYSSGFGAKSGAGS